MARSRTVIACSWLVVALSMMMTTASVRAGTILDFEDVLAEHGADTPFFTPIETQGFTLTATNPPTGFSSGFQVYGPGAGNYAGEIGVTTFAPASSPPDNLIELTKSDGTSFDLTSIDLARNFAFDPAPTVLFIGTKTDGSTVEQSFTVTVPVGTPEFQRFFFSGFDDVVSVTWGQPQLSEGLHQFSHIVIGAVVPEPSAIALMTLGTPLIFACAARRRCFGKRD